MNPPILQFRTKYRRIADIVLKVTRETYSAVVPFATLLQACVVEPEAEAYDRFREDDFLDHVLVDIPKPRWQDAAVGESAVKTRDRNAKYARDKDAPFASSRCVLVGRRYKWIVLTVNGCESGKAYFRANGCSKQVAFERAAAATARRIANVCEAYLTDAPPWCVYCVYGEYRSAGLGLIDIGDADPTTSKYIVEIKRDEAAEVADLLEADGYTVTGKPDYAAMRDQAAAARFRAKLDCNRSYDPAKPFTAK